MSLGPPAVPLSLPSSRQVAHPVPHESPPLQRPPRRPPRRPATRRARHPGRPPHRRRRLRKLPPPRRRLPPNPPLNRQASRLRPGNSESFEELAHACRDFPNARVLHGAAASSQASPSSASAAASPSPPSALELRLHRRAGPSFLQECPQDAILVTHSPPKGAVDVATSGKSLGSTAIRAAIERTRPRLVVCGHIHASPARLHTWARPPSSTPAQTASSTTCQPSPHPERRLGNRGFAKGLQPWPPRRVAGDRRETTENRGQGGGVNMTTSWKKLAEPGRLAATRR